MHSSTALWERLKSAAAEKLKGQDLSYLCHCARSLLSFIYQMPDHAGYKKNYDTLQSCSQVLLKLLNQGTYVAADCKCIQCMNEVDPKEEGTCTSGETHKVTRTLIWQCLLLSRCLFQDSCMADQDLQDCVQKQTVILYCIPKDKDEVRNSPLEFHNH